MRQIKLLWSTFKQNKNFGDELSPYIISKLTRQKITCILPIFNTQKNVYSYLKLWMHFVKEYGIFTVFKNYIYRKKAHILALGSIINRTNKKSIVWGSGIIIRADKIHNADFRAVRGPLTQQRLSELGYVVPQEMGDPGLLLSKIFFPNKQLKYKIGIIPHASDYVFISSIIKNDKIKLIDVRSDKVEDIINQINMCSIVVSSSLHGIIISHSYEIPALWFVFSNSIGGDNIKFYDYYYSLEMFNPIYFTLKSCCLNSIDEIYSLYEQNKAITLPNKDIVNLRCEELLKTAPFRINIDE